MFLGFFFNDSQLKRNYHKSTYCTVLYNPTEVKVRFLTLTPGGPSLPGDPGPPGTP